MKSYLNPCYLCNDNDPEVLFCARYAGKVQPLENIVICQKCGLVYKYPVIPEYETVHYMSSKQWDNTFFEKKLAGTAAFISNNLPNVTGIVMDIGAAAGHLLNYLTKVYSTAQFVGVEPSINACSSAKQLNSALFMLPSTLEEVVVSEKSVSLITSIGVDYLFLDHTAALRKIHTMLKPDGHLYIERNVFLHSRATASFAINTKADMFEANNMMKTWFTETQMAQQLSKFFDIVANNRYTPNSVGGHPNVHLGWLCTPKEEPNEKISIVNEYQANKAYLASLPQR